MTKLNIAKLSLELSAAGLGGLADISNPDNTKAHAYLNFIPEATAAQIAQAEAILAAHDGQPLGLVDCSTTGAKLIGVVGDGTRAFLPKEYTVFCRAYGSAVPTVSLGTNASSYDNLQAVVSLTQFNGIGKGQNFQIGSYTAILTPTPVYLNVTIAAAGYVLGAQFEGRWFAYQ